MSTGKPPKGPSDPKVIKITRKQRPKAEPKLLWEPMTPVVRQDHKQILLDAYLLDPRGYLDLLGMLDFLMRVERRKYRLLVGLIVVNSAALIAHIYGLV